MAFEDYQNLNFSALDSRLVKSYAEHFWTEEKLRLNKFIYSVASYYNINKVKLDFSESSLEVLNNWLLNHVKCVKLTPEEYDYVRKSVPDYININDWRFSNETFSNIINVGLYLGEVMIHRHPDLKWEQCLKGKKNINYGQMIIKLGNREMNPMRLVNVICLEIVDNKNTATSLLELLHIWEKYV